MPEKKLDCRGLACPNPVLKTKELVDGGDMERLTVIVDNDAARENVSRFLTRSGYQVQIEATEGEFAVSGSRSSETACGVFVPEPGQDAYKIMVMVGTDKMGRGDDELGRKLMINFISTLKEMGPSLWSLILVNGGVKLSIEGSAVLNALQELERDNVNILVCGTCLNHFGILGQKQVGETTNMLDIVTSMQLADRVISLT
jgi:selenium metabolism protein YedF